MRTVAMKNRVPLGPLGPLGVLVDPMTWRAAPYLLVSGALGLLGYFVLAFTISVSLVLTVVWVGVPLAIATVLLWRGRARLERWLLRLAFGVEIADPYRPRPERGLGAHVQWLLKDPATWRDLGYLLMLLPLGAIEAVVSFGMWMVTGGLLLAPILYPLERGAGGSGYFVEDWTEAWIAGFFGVLLLVLSAYLARGMAWLHGTLATVLLGGGEEERLRASRARGIDAAEAERRRIERDLHDGAQQRLLSVAVDLGRAQSKFDSDPETVRELIAQAHAGTKAAIAELRNLARGIHPAILSDRGLDAALSGLAARAPIRVDVSVELDERPPPAVESIAYFIVAESLANMAKHSGATEASVTVIRDRRGVVVDVWDDGIGGAAVVPGGGLSGLADRAATIDGVLVVHSPMGGPTIVRAELPCEW
ncbi:signal transduction histidine kinase [Nonomuraea thailandensis]|uniref:histidine kinase n=1 Tax=Nonomuraea thailandensis TaxID=1188745 RepID=A0A9X2GW08_9ACTN|nr:sensor histidine kinase [Nonomuraea thailandensis]MCP2361393.1 signal transduction histidine kinase [Nonomuraea thailandensis]